MVALLVLTILYASQLFRLISFSLDQGSDSYIAIAPVIAAYLVWVSRDRIFRALSFALVPGAGVAAVALTSVLVAIRYKGSLGTNDYLSLIALSYCLFILGIFLACFGRKAFRAALFPLCMLFFFVPLPAELAEKIVTALQAGSATLVYLLFSVLHVPVLRDGLVFTVPGVSIEIAAECSGINSSLALLITGLLVADASFRKLSSKLIFVLVTLPLSIVKNGVRIVTLTMLATKVDMGFLTGKLHHRGGFVFFLITLALMVPIWKLLLKREQRLLSRGHPLPRAANAVSSL